MPRPTRWKGCVNGLKGRVRACFICPPIRLTSTPSKWPAPKLSSSCARLKRALWKHSMRRLLRPYKLFLRAMLKASSSMSDSVYDPYGNRYRCIREGCSLKQSSFYRVWCVVPPRWQAQRSSSSKEIFALTRWLVIALVLLPTAAVADEGRKMSLQGQLGTKLYGQQF